jgi:hypothetical protein
LPLHQGLAFAGTAEDDDEDAAEDDEGEGDGQNNISVWTLSDDSALLWSLTSIIDLEITLPAGAINPVYSPSAVGFVEGEATICIDSGEKIFTAEVESKKTTDIGPSARTLAVFPFLHFHMPTLPKVSTKQFFLTFFPLLLQSSNPVYFYSLYCRQKVMKIVEHVTLEQLQKNPFRKQVRCCMCTLLIVFINAFV